MKTEHLKEAQQIVERIAAIDKSLTRELCSRQNQLSVKDGNGETYLYISRAVAEKALEMQKAELRSNRAALIRRANQIGLVL